MGAESGGKRIFYLVHHITVSYFLSVPVPGDTSLFSFVGLAYSTNMVQTFCHGHVATLGVASGQHPDLLSEFITAFCRSKHDAMLLERFGCLALFYNYLTRL